MSGNLKIGDLGKRTDCPVETIRYYEQEGLLPAPARSQSNYRLYGDAHVERLQFIRHCRSLDMTLDEIRSLLRFRDAPEDNCEEVNLLLDQHIGHVARRMAPRRNKLVNFAGRSGRVAALLVVAIARYGSSSRLAPHPATAAKLPNLSLRGA
jgi:Cd(II)/Pb(II)-responsive transcriptional regulator